LRTSDYLARSIGKALAELASNRALSCAFVIAIVGVFCAHCVSSDTIRMSVWGTSVLIAFACTVVLLGATFKIGSTKYYVTIGVAFFSGTVLGLISIAAYFTWCVTVDPRSSLSQGVINLILGRDNQEVPEVVAALALVAIYPGIVGAVITLGSSVFRCQRIEPSNDSICGS
jgi:hypothetical protein